MMYHCSQLAIAIRGEQWLDTKSNNYKSLSLELGFCIPVDVTWISEKAQESRSHNSNFPDSKFQQPKISRIPDSKSKISRIPDSTSKHFTDSLTSGDLCDETESNLVPSM